MGKWGKRLVVALPLLALAGAAGAPYLSADMYRDQVRESLERMLGRRVDLQGEARFQLYPRPGISLTRVVIHEVPDLGIEPVAYLDYPDSELDVSLAPLSLLTGKVKVTGVRLVSPSLNLTKLADGSWSFQRLLDRAVGEGRAAGFELEAIEVRGGRLNFKIGDVKSVFYLADADLRVEADPSNRNRYGIVIEGDPARTDRTSSSFGRLTGRGMLTLGRGGEESRIDLSLAIARTPIAEIVTALQGRSIGLGGFVASQARLNGPLSAVAIDGRLDLNEAERFGWLVPRLAAGRGLPFKGLLDWPGQEFRLNTAAPAPVSMRMRAFHLFSEPRWAMLWAIADAPLGSMRALAGELGISLPSEAPLEGNFAGVLGYSSTHGPKGQMQIANASVAVPDLPATKLAEARVIVDNHRWQVPATEIRFSEREAVTVELAGDSSRASREMAIASAGFDVERSRRLWQFLAGGGDPPFFDRCRQGNWAGSVRYAQPDASSPGAWSGDLRATGAVCAVDGVADPARVDAAQINVMGAAMTARRINARVGKLVLTGDADYDPGRRRPLRLRLSVAGESQAAEVERLLAPALRRERGFISRTFGSSRVALPEWLASRRLDAVLQFAALAAGEVRVEGVSARLSWDGAAIDVPDFNATLGRGGTAKGSMKVSLAGAAPEYRGRLIVANAALREGRIDGEGEWETAGTGGVQWLGAMKAKGAFQARGNVLAAAEPPLDALAGEFVLAPPARLQLTALQATYEETGWQGEGGAASDGRVVFDLTAGTRALKASGKLW